MYLLNCNKSYRTVLLGFLFCFGSLNAFAQFGGGMGGMGGSKRSGNYDRSSRSDSSRNQNPERVVESLNNSDQLLTRLGTLQFDMKLTEEQMPNWSKFDSKVRTYIEDLEREKIRSIPVPIGETSTTMSHSGISYVSKMVDSVRNRYADLEDIESAYKNLHLSLSPFQKIILDARISSILVREIGR